MVDHKLRNALANFKACSSHAPDGRYEASKALNALIGETCDKLTCVNRHPGIQPPTNQEAV